MKGYQLKNYSTDFKTYRGEERKRIIKRRNEEIKKRIGKKGKKVKIERHQEKRIEEIPQEVY